MIGEDLILSYVVDCAGIRDSNSSKTVTDILISYLCHEINFKKCCDQVYREVGHTKAPEKLHLILTQAKSPPLNEFDDSNSTIDANSKRRKNHGWTPQEDNRLLYGIMKNGLSKWGDIATFVGNGRTRSQCSQRWNRCLDPTIVKDKWSEDDDKKLFDLVHKFGPHSWAKIAQIMETRTDVQCRYRYQLINKRMNIPHKKVSPPSHPSERKVAPQNTEKIQQTPKEKNYINTPVLTGEEMFFTNPFTDPMGNYVPSQDVIPAVAHQNEQQEHRKNFEYQNPLYAKMDSIWEQLFSNEQMLNFSF